ncbi:PhzF family phenazine biosynthesis isomerase [Paenalkalicoccus suaedae]|uniref:PhzF family phenazine biosynthesis isomerase n=1 Tax=Paenalkalicoccus suaedae TaxID=2592382 RepID=A0A859FIS9_9BACI|nr:PhzF family phenazine biosynthesis isomerase [Paenalkalicoccus suaedae]QKS72818.1 PhzF family phenazine biosynthesis isomerase [Paenalkalicoccus suaedae]
MKVITVYQYDAFSREPGKGNPAGVVLDGADLSDAEMQEVAYRAGFNETAFVLESDVADLQFRYFTPGHEMNLCGHGTMAAVYACQSHNFLGGKSELTIETKAGILPIHIDGSAITMKQAQPEFMEFAGSREALANAIGLEEAELHGDLPILYGSTGTWTLLVPIKELDSFDKMVPATQDFPQILKELPTASVHPFCLATHDPAAEMHARHFSSAASGTIEDAVTGTASAVMGAYYASFLENKDEQHLHLVVEQGQEMGKDGRVDVHVSRSGDTVDIHITGNAVYVEERKVELL